MKPSRYVCLCGEGVHVNRKYTTFDMKNQKLERHFHNQISDQFHKNTDANYITFWEGQEGRQTPPNKT